MNERGTLKDELKQTKPFGSAEEEAFLALLRTADLARGGAEAVAGELGITAQQYNVLRILRGAGEEGLPTLSIADRMVERSPGVTRLIDRLVAKKFVNRRPVPGDRRRVQCCITSGGLEVLSQLDGVMDEYNRKVLSPLGPRDVRQLIRLLGRIRAG